MTSPIPQHLSQTRLPNLLIIYPLWLLYHAERAQVSPVPQVPDPFHLSKKNCGASRLRTKVPRWPCLIPTLRRLRLPPLPNLSNNQQRVHGPPRSSIPSLSGARSHSRLSLRVILAHSLTTQHHTTTSGTSSACDRCTHRQRCKLSVL